MAHTHICVLMLHTGDFVSAHHQQRLKFLGCHPNLVTTNLESLRRAEDSTRLAVFPIIQWSSAKFGMSNAKTRTVTLKWPMVFRIIVQCDFPFQPFQDKKPGCSHHKSFASSLAFHLLLVVHPLHSPHPQSSTRRGRGRCRCAHNPHDRHRSGQRLRSCSWPLKPHACKSMCHSWLQLN